MRRALRVAVSTRQHRAAISGDRAKEGLFMEERRAVPAGSTGTRRVYGGLYSDPAAAELGIRRFRDSGYEGDRLGIVTRDREEAKELAESTGAKAASGAATGAVTGGILGGITGLLVGIGA